MAGNVYEVHSQVVPQPLENLLASLLDMITIITSVVAM